MLPVIQKKRELNFFVNYWHVIHGTIVGGQNHDIMSVGSYLRSNARVGRIISRDYLECPFLHVEDSLRAELEWHFEEEYDSASDYFDDNFGGDDNATSIEKKTLIADEMLALWEELISIRKLVLPVRPEDICDEHIDGVKE